MKTIPEIIREILNGICPQSEIGCIMAIIAIDMIYMEIGGLS